MRVGEQRFRCAVRSLCEAPSTCASALGAEQRKLKRHAHPRRDTRCEVWLRSAGGGPAHLLGSAECCASSDLDGQVWPCQKRTRLARGFTGMSVPGILFLDACIMRTPHLGRPGGQSVTLLKPDNGSSTEDPGNEAGTFSKECHPEVSKV